MVGVMLVGCIVSDVDKFDSVGDMVFVKVVVIYIV